MDTASAAFLAPAQACHNKDFRLPLQSNRSTLCNQIIEYERTFLKFIKTNVRTVFLYTLWCME